MDGEEAPTGSFASIHLSSHSLPFTHPFINLHTPPVYRLNLPSIPFFSSDGPSPVSSSFHLFSASRSENHLLDLCCASPILSLEKKMKATIKAN